jgi:aromatic ring-opening dioxygenase catalytic subunit (LigB family)
MSPTSGTKQPTLYIPHGGGPCFFMDWTMGPPDTWDALAAWLREMPATLPEPPRALLVVSAHWEAPVPTVTSAAAPPLFYDYYGFPPHTYQLTWPAPGDPSLAERVRGLLSSAGIDSAADARRGFDHGVFVPLKVAYPEPRTPTVQLSLQAGLDPARHLAIGRALEPLRREGVLIVGSGMSYHNMRGFMSPASLATSQRFDAWLDATVRSSPRERDAALARWASAPAARECHPREEHLIPLMVAAGAAGDDRGAAGFRGVAMGVQIASVAFG